MRCRTNFTLLLLPLLACGSPRVDGASAATAGGARGDAGPATEAPPSSVRGERASTEATAPRHLVAVGAIHECAVIRGGVKCWGDNAHGQLGSPLPPPRHGSVEAIKGGATAVVAGDMHTCAIVGGSLLCWGWGSRGSLGFVAGEAHPTPTRVALRGRVADVAADEKITCAALEDHSVWCWGANGGERIGIAEPTRSAVRGAVLTMAGASTVCASNGARLQCQSFEGEKVSVASPRPMTERVADSDAEIRGRFGLSKVEDVVGFQGFKCALGDGGRVRCAGTRMPWGERGKTVTIADLPLAGPGRAVAIGANPARVCALIDDDSLVCSGEERRRR